MAVSDDARYNYLSEECRYKNEKISEAFNLFIKMATSITAGVFYIHSILGEDNPQRLTLRHGAIAIFILISGTSLFLILNHTRSWYNHRNQKHELFPEIPAPGGWGWISTELVMFFVIVFTFVAFMILNPL
ncbi:hypothetical protein ACFL6H_07015 [Candidatus Latescibacterota bacterium]